MELAIDRRWLAIAGNDGNKTYLIRLTADTNRDSTSKFFTCVAIR